MEIHTQVFRGHLPNRGKLMIANAPDLSSFRVADFTPTGEVSNSQ